MTFRAEENFSAPPEVVFNVVTDPERLARWLPEQLRVADTGQRCLRVAWNDPPVRDGPSAESPEYRLVVLPEHLRVEWRPSGPDGWAGFLQVRQVATGGAQAEVCVQPCGEAADDRVSERIRRLLEETLANLRTEVADNLTAG
ncbi:MAG: SRPBCC domain-containing protein [Micromonosporaceae bacterium]|nr:SRPBCC domain-containing protein [Micromonosporaceae bacterium]